MMNTNITRRRFLSQAAVGLSATLGLPAFVSGADANSKLQVACVGVNGMGLADLSEIGSHPKVKFTGFCDVDKNRFTQADAKFPGVPHFEDYREMLTTLGSRCDAVSVSTPDHMHAPVSMLAMRLGKHVFCQKPLARTVWEARQMRLQAARGGLTTQMGNQIHSAVEYRTAVKLLKDGAIGKIKQVHSYIGVHGRQYSNRTDRPPEAPVPESLNWNLWIGSSPMRPYASDSYHPFKWRDWQDFGSGALGDFGCHVMDPIFTALGLTAPLTIRAEHAGTNAEVWPGPETVHYLFPGTSLSADSYLPLVWRDGGLQPPLLPGEFKLPKGGGGSLIMGEEGVMLLPHVAMPRLYPESKFKGFKLPEVPGLNHWHVWVDAILAGKTTSDGFHYAGPLAETVQLGNVAARMPGVELKWDAEALKITNSPEANALLTKNYRPGFEVKPA
jgi:predicted dehydrogenase